MAEWVWNEARRCWESADRRIYETQDGGFVISDADCWMPGWYDSRAAAEMAFERYDGVLQALQDRKNAEAGGAGGVITLADLTDEKKL